MVGNFLRRGIRCGSISLYQPIIHVVGVGERFSRGQREWTAATEVRGYSVKFYRIWMLFLRIPTDQQYPVWPEDMRYSRERSVHNALFVNPVTEHTI